MSASGCPSPVVPVVPEGGEAGKRSRVRLQPATPDAGPADRPPSGKKPDRKPDPGPDQIDTSPEAVQAAEDYRRHIAGHPDCSPELRRLIVEARGVGKYRDSGKPILEHETPAMVKVAIARVFQQQAQQVIVRRAP